MEPSQPAVSPFQVQRLYLRESTCKVPAAPAIYKLTGQPQTAFELQIKQQAIETGVYEVVLHVTVTTKLQDRTALILDVQQAGLFKCESTEPTILARLLNVDCPALLYPYLCRAIAEASFHAGFPPISLAPLQFDQLYATQLAQQAATGDPSTQLPAETTTMPLSAQEIN